MYHYKINHSGMNVIQTVKLIQIISDMDLMVTKSDDEYIYIISRTEIDNIFFIKC